MPDRIVRAAILTSERVNQLDPPTEVFYRRLMNVVDDFGRYDGRPAIIRAACFPLRLDKVREADISRWTAACQKAGLIVLYEVDQKPYVELLNLCDRRRAQHSKYPPPPDDTCAHVKTRENTCRHVRPDSDLDSDARSENTPPEGAVLSPGFARFWEEWPPKHFRKEERKRCLAKWNAEKLEDRAESVLASLRAWKASEPWSDAQYIPAPLVWLNRQRYEHSPPPRKESRNGSTPRPAAVPAGREDY